ncbi:hypothetical protein N0V84_004938 [Fusarium piperis]|uniref:Uncharacterized protein n=1 Tax=Fusarium piperis TaxID=1435070 RepID=A0A9W8WEN7_9HYPO|nr:hypothetical protein N0V84_004938 [Fusarium piperis]
MNYSSLSRREAGGLGLGWILAFSVGGAILLFAAIGFLLTWRIKSRAEPESTSLYQVSDNSDDHRRSIFTKRLVKKNYSMSKSGSRLSLSLPPVLPPLPTHNSFTFFSGNGKRGRSSSWVEEDKFHGPKVSRSRRDSLFSRDSWLGRAPTLPTLMLEDDLEKGKPSELPADQPTTHLGEQQSLETLKPSKTAPELPTPPQELQTSPVRIPPLAHVRASVTELDLRDILRCTDQRLRDGSSQSPTKTPRVSPSKRSQKISSLRGTPHSLKTPRSHRTTSSLDSTNTTGTVRINPVAPSPSKRSTIHGVPRPGHNRSVSISSIGSAANSLIAEATQELGLPGGLSSPSRLRGRQWQSLDGNSPQKDPTPKKKSVEKHSPERRESQDSEASSSLSTLYSANEPEDKEQPDPFVERKKKQGALSSESRSSLFGPRSLRSRTRTLSISIPAGQTVFNTQQGQLKSNSVSTQAVGGPPLSIVLQPPQEYLHRDVSLGNRDRHGFALAYPVTGSMTSMVTPSVTTATDEDSSLYLDDRKSESPRLDVPGRPIWPPLQDRNTLVVGAPTSPLTTASSPFDEQDMMALLMGTAIPRRTLPDPPRHIAQVEHIVMPTPLCPRPRRDFSQHLHRMSMASPESSVNEGESIVDDPGAVSTGSPLRRSLSRSLRDPPSGPPPAMMSMGSLGNSIVELRRMNSMVSSYSATSMASSHNEPDSPTLPNPLNSTFSRGRLTSNPRMSTSGRQNYLNLGSPRKSLSGAVSAATPTRPIPPSKSSRSNLGVEIREDEVDAGKENQGPELKVPRLDVATGLRETRRSGNLGRDTRDSILTTRATGKTKLGALSKREVQRQSVESLGLYDKDGFLKASPENKGRCLRM